MQVSPSLDQSPALWPRAFRLCGCEHLVCWHDPNQRVRPVRNEDHCTDQPEPFIGLPPRDDAQEKSDYGQRRLHGEATLICRFPFSEEGSVVQVQTGGLLGDIDVARCSSKKCGDNEGELARKHTTSHLRGHSASE